MMGFIGAGNMGGCLIRAVLNLNDHPVIVYDHHDRSKDFKNQQVIMARDELEVVKKSDQLFLCIKPKDFTALAQLISGSVKPEQLIFSVMAGVSLEQIEHGLSDQSANHQTLKLIRVMPNTPSLIAQGAGGMAFSTEVDREEKKKALELFNQIGYYIEVPEAKIHAVTALSGAGPAYMFMILESMADAGVLLGLSRDQSIKLAAKTMAGSAEMLLKMKSHPMVLKDQVTSPGGITIEALSHLEKQGLPYAILKAIKKAYQKSISMEQKSNL